MPQGTIRRARAEDQGGSKQQGSSNVKDGQWHQALEDVAHMPDDDEDVRSGGRPKADHAQERVRVGSWAELDL